MASYIVRCCGVRIMPEIFDHIFFSSASQYYVAGRLAVFAALNPVAANLMHHAVEMYLKGALLKSKTKTLMELKQQLGHSLPKCWEAFKAQVNDPALNKFDDVVSEIHKYEELRYPDENSKGMQSMFDVVRWTPPSLPTTAMDPVPSYRLCLPDVDELIAASFSAASIGQQYLGFIKPEANEYVAREYHESTLTGLKAR
jgi:hypothetical protein